MTTCRDGVDVLAAWTDGVLDGGTRAAIERHLAGCARCRGFARSYLATPRIVREATGEALPRGLAARLRRLAGAWARPPRSPRARRP